jgi:Domain of unknown function (DUF4397)
MASSISRFLLAASAVVLAACAKDNTSGPDLGTSRVRFMHAVPDTGALDVRTNSRLTVAMTAVPYGQASEYEAVTAGLVTFSAQPAPSTSADVPRSVANLSAIQIPNGASVTLVAAGESRDTVGARAAGMTAYLDDVTAPASGQARLRVINSSPDAGAVDVYATLAGSAAGAVPTFPGVDYKSAVTRTLAAGSYVLTITPLSEPGTVLATTSVALPAGGVQTMVVRGYAGTLPVGLPTTRRISGTVLVNRAP